jgi:hypothetical protein
LKHTEKVGFWNGALRQETLDRSWPLPYSAGQERRLRRAMLLVEAACKIACLILTRKDEKIKDLLGFHALGSSHPWDWQADHAEAVTAMMTRQESLSSLADVARRAIKAGDRSKAAFCLWLAMHNPDNIETQDMFDRLLAG